MARESGLAPAFLRELMQAVGRPNPGRGERIFTDEDIETARVIKRFVDAGLPRRELLEVGRVVGQGMSHTSEAVRRLVGNALLQPGDSEYTVGLRFAAGGRRARAAGAPCSTTSSARTCATACAAS